MNRFKSNLLLWIISSAISNTALANTDSFSELSRSTSNSNSNKYSEDNKQEFYRWLDIYFTEYENWRDEYTKNLDEQRLSLIDTWGEAEISDNHKHVEYDDIKSTRKIIDYEHNTATISIIVDKSTDINNPDILKDSNTKQEINGYSIDLNKAVISESLINYSLINENKEKQFIITQTELQMNELDIQTERLLRANTGVPDSFIQERAYNKKKSLLRNAHQRISLIVKKYDSIRDKFSNNNTLSNENSLVIVDKDNTVSKPAIIPKKIDDNKIDSLAENNTNIIAVSSAQTLTTESETITTPELNVTKKLIPEKKIISYTVNLPQNSLKDRALTYLPLAIEESQRWDINTPLIMAIIHSESAFRPDAKSHIPAFGLMQVVPSSAGHDVNKHVRNIDAPMKSSDLYVPPINIETGSAYLNILNTKYLKSIKNDKSRLYCVIAAYNTGAGNVARAFNENRSTNINNASKIINSMTPEEVYNHLYNNLPYDETKNYLKKVTSRISLYEENT
ncbi:hypothetical protein A9264_14715 [Vibrio sp. UCD-FRSSP16_10]|uniref:transglycosylase SLT domain-containing protein n=1 Tax=unclassified Vibrio TaxID=2614977 RepID=UPI0007FFB425|nr:MULTISPECIES: transglycosylase SLT domain-containing protein [unclassified Vibrio]OBT09487.1 hypothetical protein A9260_06600 [Vibrio sp. UCD-FRSSP16_30]OBT19529.1 hypothetical protein A9264_14715 [Vibrio sp. UCD-FRSSP16_10]